MVAARPIPGAAPAPPLAHIFLPSLGSAATTAGVAAAGDAGAGGPAPFTFLH
jgi:hypothetical protein